MVPTLLENLRRNQGFAAVLASGDEISRLAARYLDAAMFTPDAAARGDSIDKLKRDIFDHFRTDTMDTARRTGLENAAAVIRQLATESSTQPSPAAPPDLNNPQLRGRVLLEFNAKAADRLKIFSAGLNDAGNTLGNRLVQHYLEPGDNAQQKVDALRKLHAEQSVLEAKYSAGQRDHLLGNGNPPRKPPLDFMSRFTNVVKGEAFTQARRAGTDAETALFVQRGHVLLAWIVVNAAEACPDCKLRAGVVGNAAFWDRMGRPGSGKTICKARCFCMLVPAETMKLHPSLKRGLDARTAVITTPGDVEIFNRRRAGDLTAGQP